MISSSLRGPYASPVKVSRLVRDHSQLSNHSFCRCGDGSKIGAQLRGLAVVISTRNEKQGCGSHGAVRLIERKPVFPQRAVDLLGTAPLLRGHVEDKGSVAVARHAARELKMIVRIRRMDVAIERGRVDGFPR